jgi:hypothetical protein
MPESVAGVREAALWCVIGGSWCVVGRKLDVGDAWVVVRVGR